MAHITFKANARGTALGTTAEVKLRAPFQEWGVGEVFISSWRVSHRDAKQNLIQTATALRDQLTELIERESK